MSELTLSISFLAGLVSFFSPCVLPLIPAFMGYLAGTNVKNASRWLLFWHSLLFVLGFSAVFALLGALLNSVLSNVAYTAQYWLDKVAGIIIILFGLYLVGLIKLKFLQTTHKISVKRLPSKELTSFVFGAAFAVGWTPCVGAILGSILALAASMPGQSFALLLAYAIGLGLPFLFAGFFAKEFVNWIKKSDKLLRNFNLVVGILIILLGLLVFTGRLAVVAGYLVLITL